MSLFVVPDDDFDSELLNSQLLESQFSEMMQIESLPAPQSSPNSLDTTKVNAKYLLVTCATEQNEANAIRLVLVLCSRADLGTKVTCPQMEFQQSKA
jgi:hypothetical protein